MTGGHAKKFRALFILHDHRATHFLDRLDAHGAVAADAGKHHRDGAFFKTGRRFEQPPTPIAIMIGSRWG